MATLNFFNQYKDDLHKGKHDWSAHTYKWMLTNVAPVATNSVKSDITEISAGNGYTAGGATGAITLQNSAGTETVKVANGAWTAAGGSIGPFRYAVLYNDTQTTPVKPLVCWFDYGGALTIAVGEAFTVDTGGDANDVLYTA